MEGTASYAQISEMITLLEGGSRPLIGPDHPFNQIAYQIDPYAWLLLHKYPRSRLKRRSQAENRAYYRAHKQEFRLRYLYGASLHEGLGLALWQLCTGELPFIVLVSRDPDHERDAIDVVLEGPLVRRDFGDVMKDRRIKVVGFKSMTAFPASFKGRRPDLIIVDGTPALYGDDVVDAWLTRVVKDSHAPKGGVVLLNCTPDYKIAIEIDGKHIGYAKSFKTKEVES